MVSPKLNKTELAILQELQEPSLTLPSRAELARQTKSPTHPGHDLEVGTLDKHLKGLAEKKIIKSYSANLDVEELGFEFMAFIRVKMAVLSQEAGFKAVIKKIDHVLWCYKVTGKGTDYLLLMVAPNRKTFNQVLEQIRGIPGLADTATFLVAEEVKNTTALPLDHLQATPSPHAIAGSQNGTQNGTTRPSGQH